MAGMFDAMERGELTALFGIGENPMGSEADHHRTQKLLEDQSARVLFELLVLAGAEELLLLVVELLGR